MPRRSQRRPRLVYRLECVGPWPIAAYDRADERTSAEDYLVPVREQSVEALLEEAFRFFAFRNRQIAKRSWPSISPDARADAVFDLRWAYHNALRDNIHELYLSRNLDRYYDPDRILYKVRTRGGMRPSRRVFHDPAHKARYAVRAFLSEQFRTPDFVENEPQRGQFHGVELDRIPERLRRGNELMAELLGPDGLPNPTATEIYAWPEIAGHRTLLEHRPAFTGDNPRSSVPWLSEHLYIVLGSGGARELERRAKVRKLRFTEAPPEVRRLERLTREANAGLSSLDERSWTALRPWRAWERALDELEAYFAAAFHDAEWALALIAVLRWYLTSLKLRTLMTALPSYALYDGYWRRGAGGANAYAGLALWEALSGRALDHPVLPSVLDAELPVDDVYTIEDGRARAQDERYGVATHPISLIGALEDWPALAADSPIASEESELLYEFALNPVIIRRRRAPPRERPATPGSPAEIPAPPHERDYVYDHTIIEDQPSFVEFRTPIIYRRTNSAGVDAEDDPRPDFYAITRSLRNGSVSQLEMGATFATQAHYFVAAALLARASDLTGLEDHYRKKEEDRTPAERREIERLSKAVGPPRNPSTECRKYAQRLKDRRELQRLLATNRFRLGSGSNVAGGQNPPHKTHRNGRNYDLNMGPDLIPWPDSQKRVFLEAAYPALIEAGLLKPADATLARFDRRGHVTGADRLYEVHADPDAACRPVNPHVLHSKMRTIENRAIRRVAGSTSPEDFEESENELAGTPHFVREADGELPHIGQLCLLLSGASQIIYASPIVHIRAIRAMNEAALQMDVRTGTGQVSAILPRPRHGYLVEAGEIARFTSFVFFPADHHHHWHVVYPETFGRPRLLWLRLGVDLSPLLRYLRKIEKGRLLKAGPALDELKGVVEVLEAYVEDYDRIYADEAQRDAADAFVREMFAPFVASVSIAGGGSLLSPAAGRKLSEENELRRESAGINGHIEAMRALVLKNVLRFEDLKRVERLSQVLNETFSYEELMDAYGKLEEEEASSTFWQDEDYAIEPEDPWAPWKQD